MALKAILADNQVMFAEGIQAILKDLRYPPVKVVGIAHTQDELESMTHYNSDLLIINSEMYSTENFSWVSHIKSAMPGAKIIILADECENRAIKNAFQNKVDGYVMKSNHALELMQCIDRVVEGHTYMSDGIRISPEYINPSPSLLKYEERFSFKQKLTKREREILSLIVQCKNNKVIANELFISDQTASVHRKSIMKKFGVNSTNALIKFTIENQIV